MPPFPAPESVPRLDAFRRATLELLETLQREGRAPKTIEGYEYALRRAHALLKGLGTPPAPSRLTETHIRALEAGLTPHVLRQLSVCLRAMGAPATVRYVIPPRTHVRWLTPEQAVQVLDAAEDLGMPYRACAHLELELGFRRISVSRARVEDFLRLPQVYVRGKPSPRGDYTIWAGGRTAGILRDLLTWRRSTFPELPDRSGVLIPARSRKYRRIGPYSESGLDGVMSRIGRHAGVAFSNHDLRRTYGRLLWKAGVKLETISAMLGHSSVDVTLEYLGINLSDQEEAMQRFQEWLSRPKVYLSTSSQAATRD